MGRDTNLLTVLTVGGISKIRTPKIFSLFSREIPTKVVTLDIDFILK